MSFVSFFHRFGTGQFSHFRVESVRSLVRNVTIENWKDAHQRCCGCNYASANVFKALYFLAHRPRPFETNVVSIAEAVYKQEQIKENLP